MIKTLKIGLAMNLEKSGSSLEEFESLLASGDTAALSDKLASGLFGDIAGAAEKLVGVGGKALIEAPQAALALSLLVGSLGGGAAYGVDKHLQGQDARLGEKKDSINKMQNISDKLKTDYNLNG